MWPLETTIQSSSLDKFHIESSRENKIDKKTAEDILPRIHLRVFEESRSGVADFRDLQQARRHRCPFAYQGKPSLAGLGLVRTGDRANGPRTPRAGPSGTVRQEEVAPSEVTGGPIMDWAMATYYHFEVQGNRFSGFSYAWNGTESIYVILRISFDVKQFFV